ncbi:tRNA (adenosine(37)-N6)-dimethylallyltransferase MiaA [Segatella bryantii]|uniref:tRNA dimethylallyltransferase n=1 Tax=Segatella bryantii TaxID=77095 RepID=A0ABX4EJY1_SEGBR|nr:tRNA (adenosine(37)-N6)-dimethylallyltransferase MiaA [Segatella bryantii]MDR4930474.1 tRNA (adenosine(37)-N6)-dimethylallyltransferase MiaA [Segatella bryantii]OYP56876.1 tRNA (adenosine(37)-N6)-dimethylallyltransferase MiaA [Segatella bryantii]UKK81386.1 tRNA (adenosine(37)-N6)-dimethylallyltransferase MiaA [Segatella bryantii]SDL57732.1 tRNA dimethylallyltransferase [Segatella bryantii]
MKTLVVVLGPTAVGKTELCLQIAEHLKTPIINADSRQIFAELPIGTAAPTLEQQQRVKHFFVGSHHIQDYYSAAMYEEDVINMLPKLFQVHNQALLTGGSMMYIDAVCKGIDDIPTVDDQTRNLLKTKLEAEGLPSLVEELKRRDPEHWEIVDRNNPRRVVHALEICYMTGKTYTSFRKNTTKKRPFNILKIGLNRAREEMYTNINQRVLNMMENGMEEEARKVYPFKGLNSLNTVGYKELFDYFDGKISKEEAILKIQSNTRRYMRKQLTWFKRDETIKWFNPDNSKEIINYIDSNI